MKKSYTLATTTALVVALSAPAFAQGGLVGTTAIDDQIIDIEREAQKDLARGNDDQRFGPLGVPQGWRGSFAVSASDTSGNTDDGEFAVGGRLTYGVNKWVHNFGIAGEFSSTSGTSTKEQIFVSYEANRYFSDRFYAFGIGRYNYDKFGGFEHDAFLGFGPGIRVVNTEQFAWRIQAGPGVRYSETAAGVDDTTTSGLVSSRFFYKLTDTMSITNDTDILADKNNTVATNDLGLNFKVSDNMSTRFSYRTDYNSTRGALGKKYDNKLGISLVVGF